MRTLKLWWLRYQINKVRLRTRELECKIWNKEMHDRSLPFFGME